MVDLAASAVIAAGIAVLAAISDVKLAAAMAASKKSGKQRFATSHRAAAHEALAVGVVGDQALIPFELAPGNVALVMVVIKTSQSLRLRRKPRTILLRPSSMVMRLPVRPKA